MPLSDDFGDFDDDTELIAAATPVEQSQSALEQSPRPTKRRRVSRRRAHHDDTAGLQEDGDEAIEWSDSSGGGVTQQRTSQAPGQITADQIEDDPDYYFPGELGESVKKQSKYRIHIPKNGTVLQDQFFTQPPPDSSDLGRIRGPIWKKPAKAVAAPPSSVIHNFLYGIGDAANRSRAANGGSRPSIGHQTNGLLLGHGVRNHALANRPLDAVGRPVGASRSNTRVQSNSFDATNAMLDDAIEDDATLAARLQAEEDKLARQHRKPLSGPAKKVSPVNTSFGTVASQDLHPELADLPSDAFSSSPEKQRQDDVILISSQPACTGSPPRAKNLRGPQTGLKQMTVFGAPATQDLTSTQQAKEKHAWPLKSKDEPLTHHKLDEEATKTWVYPTNLGTIRDYQYNIVSRGLYHNLLVALPTGLGKTFIAATIMLNWYRWTKDAQIVFMAPTKPLIAQQMDACYSIAGIPRRDTVLMTGETQPGLRADEWLARRVFFMTPQTVINDLKTGICDPKKIVLLVVDEAHKASGGYAYTEVVAFLRRFNPSFRVLALTATPGSSVDQVQGVIDSLSISRVEIRTEASLDIRQYTHEKQTETEVFDYSMEQSLIMDLMAKAIKPVLEKLNGQNAYWSKDPMQLTAYGLTQSRGKWAQSDAGRKAPMSIKGMVNSIFTVLSSLAHSIGLLKNHGIGPFYSGMVEFQRQIDSGQTKGKYATQIAQDENFVKMMNYIRGWTNNPDFMGHPKLEYLRSVVLNHFMDAGEGRHGQDAPPAATRVMVFASYRGSTEEIARVLKRNEPMIRPHVFVGQASSKNSEGMNQKRQNAVIQDFKSGKFNTLIATSIGEEGLDIGDVDLIVCYDASASPIRMLQRIGRTGRKRLGRVQLLLMRGKENDDYAKAQDSYAFIQKSITDANKYNYHEDQSPRILPKGVAPVVDKRVIDIPLENSQPIELDERQRKGRGRPAKKRPPKKFHMPDNVRTGFVKASRLGEDAEDEDEDEDESDKPVPRKIPTKKAPTGRKTTAKPTASPEPEVAQLPYLEDVLLSNAEEKELYRKYQHIPDEGGPAPIIQGPSLARVAAQLRQPGATKYVRHGRTTKTVTLAMQYAHSIDEEKLEWLKSNRYLLDFEKQSPSYRLVDVEPDWPEPEPDQGVRRVKKTAPKKARGRSGRKTQRKNSSDMEGESSSPEPTPVNMRIGTQGIDIGLSDTEGEDIEEEPDSELEDFIVRSDQVIETVDSSQSSLPEKTPRPSGRNRLFTSQATPGDDEDEDDLPEVDALTDKENVQLISDEDSDVDVVAVAKPVKARMKRKVLDDDSDE